MTEKKKKTFADYFRQCCLESSCLVLEDGQEKEDYRQAHREYDRLYGLIRAQLEDDRLMIELDSAKNGTECLACEATYQQGFRDCVVLLRWVGLLN